MQPITIRTTTPANEFAPALYHVFDYNDMHEQISTETTADARESLLAYYREQGYQIVKVEETGRFAARFTITLSKTVPACYTFQRESDAKRKRYELSAQYKAK